MNKQVPYSSVPVGEEIEYQGIKYTRFTYERGKRYENGSPVFKHIPKHDIVTWINAWDTQIK